jgi:ketosteroid isomerase-like protein
LTTALEHGDTDGVVAFLTEDVWLKMPPLPMEYQGRDLARRFFVSIRQPTRSSGSKSLARDASAAGEKSSRGLASRG